MSMAVNEKAAKCYRRRHLALFSGTGVRRLRRLSGVCGVAC